jgi:hypothetical protein
MCTTKQDTKKELDNIRKSTKEDLDKELALARELSKDPTHQANIKQWQEQAEKLAQEAHESKMEEFKNRIAKATEESINAKLNKG